MVLTRLPSKGPPARLRCLRRTLPGMLVGLLGAALLTLAGTHGALGPLPQDQQANQAPDLLAAQELPSTLPHILRPGVPVYRCTTVVYTGTEPGGLATLIPDRTGTLSSALSLSLHVEAGTRPTGGSCDRFRATQSLFSGLATDFPGTWGQARTVALAGTGHDVTELRITYQVDPVRQGGQVAADQLQFAWTVESAT